MNIMDENKEDKVVEIKNKIEDYVSTIQASQSFISLVTWENSHRIESSKYSFGRRMDTTEENLILKNGEVTPDIVIQRNPNLGYVVEVKKSLSRDRREWEEVAKQVIKYDDALVGWWEQPGEKISALCVVLLIHISRSRDFTDFFKDYINSNNILLRNNVCIVEFARSDERVHYYILKKEFGKIQDDAIDQRLYSSVPIPIEKVVASYGNQKFCDCEPPSVEYTMAILWQDIFNSMENRRFDPKLKAYPLDVSVSQLTIELQKLNGAKENSYRDVEFPKIGWIRTALDAFVDLGYAIKIDDDNYQIRFKLIREDPISNFVNHKKKNKEIKSIQSNQLPLF